MWEGRLFGLGAAAACLLALLAKLRPLPFAFDDVGATLFQCLETDLVGFGLPAAYFRFAMPALSQESWALRLAASGAVGAAALLNLRMWEEGAAGSFGLLFGALAASYLAFAGLAPARVLDLLLAAVAGAAVWWTTDNGHLLHGAVFVMAMGTALFAERCLKSKSWKWPGAALAGLLGAAALPPLARRALAFLLPFQEFARAYEVVGEFLGAENQARLATKPVIVSVFCQVSLGYLGVAFLRRGQERKNALVSVGEGRLPARGFARLVALYMLGAAVPYMLQRTVMENVNGYVVGHIQAEVERSMRIGGFFSKDLLLGAVRGSEYTVEGYTDAFNSIVEDTYGMIERKLFSLPKLILLPGMVINQPRLVISVLPASVVLDVCRARLITSLTRKIEALARRIRELANRRRKIEEHDTKQEEMIRRGAAVDFVKAGWHDLARQIEAKTLRAQSLKMVRDFINFLYTQNMLYPGIELVLAFLLEARQILLADTWVYTRVVEDTIDLALTRFRSDAMLATLKTNVNIVSDLSERLAQVRERGKADCTVATSADSIRIQGLRYKRGSALEVHLQDLSLKAGRVYAVTGPNGSGKSSLFGLLASCGRQATMLPEGMKVLELASLTLPSDDVVEITQQLYCPLFVKPLAWLLQVPDIGKLPQEEVQKYEQQINELTRELEFHREDDGSEGGEAGLSVDDLHTEMDDWYGSLSGGQRGKVELIRKVFLRSHCPSLLLLDEAFAPLDPKSKQLVQQKLKEFCKNSVVLVIYHGGAMEKCIPSDAFFDESLHFGNGTAQLVPTC